ncbi:MAG: hypothetical protein HZB14_04190 [Actinobacteria bacterium]|nr:hypothetical protein [Actinomycetota bacterium]
MILAMARKMTNNEEGRFNGLFTSLELQAEGHIVQHDIRFCWARRVVKEGSYIGHKGEMKTVLDTFDLWLEEAPGDPLRKPDMHASSAREAAKELLAYERRVKLD